MQSSSSITEYQMSMLNFLIRVGYGWRRYAESVRDSGRCSEKQHKTLLRMVSTIEYKNNNKWGGESDIDWDDKGDFYGCVKVI